MSVKRAEAAEVAEATGAEGMTLTCSADSPGYFGGCHRGVTTCASSS